MVNPPTVSFWGNWFMSQWDIFIQTSEIAQNSNLILSVYSKNNSSFVQFRQAHSQSYDLFREYMQVLDFSVLDIQTLQIKATFLHCTKAHGVYSQDYILNQVKQGQIFVKQSQEFNDIYNEFASVSFGVTVFDLVECVSYISQFFALPISNTLPFVIQDMKEPIQVNIL